jgi:Aspartyl protease
MKKRWLFLSVLLLTPQILLAQGVVSGQDNRQDESLRHFERVGLNVFVPVTITGTDGKSETVDFILDSGSNRTIIDETVASALALLPFHTSTTISPTGSALRHTTQVTRLCSMSRCTDMLEALVDDLSIYNKGYGRRVGGLLAMDFLQKYILVLDLSADRIGLFPSGTKLTEFVGAKTVQIISEKGLALLEVVLPNGKSTKLIFDTGYDSVSDALLFESEIGRLNFVQEAEREIRDANGSNRAKVGRIESLEIGEIRLAPALIQLSEQTSAERSSLEYGGMLGLFPFRGWMIAVDYPSLKMYMRVGSSATKAGHALGSQM